MISIFKGGTRSLSALDPSQTFVQVHHAILPHMKSFTASEWMVFSVLSLHMDGNGFCFPSIATVATLTGLSVPTVRRAIEGLTSLEIDGHRILACRYRHDKSGRQTSNGYILFPDAVGEGIKNIRGEGASFEREEGIKIDTPINKNKKEQESQGTDIKRSRQVKLPPQEDPGRMLFEAYRFVVYPELMASEFNLAEWASARHVVYQMHQRGITPQQVENAASTLIRKWNGRRDIVTIHALWKHWSAATTGTPVVAQGQPGKGRSMQDVAVSAIDVFRKVSGEE
jgi:hypothetical protein